MNPIDINDIAKCSPGSITSRELIKSGNFSLTLFCMGKGTEMSEHTSTKRGYVHVLTGEGIFNLQGKQLEMKPGVSITMDKDAEHALKAKENTTFLLALIG